MVVDMKIALICAVPDLSNSGMLSVDLAFESLRKYLNDDIQIVRFCSWKDIVREGPIPLYYRRLHDVSQLEEFDKIIYWGDFLHWIKYGPSFMSSKGTSWYCDQNNLSIEDARHLLTNEWYRLYLLEGRQDLQKKSIVFGGTIYGIDSTQMSNTRYRDALTSMYKNASLVLARDYLSSFFISQLSEQRKFSYGCDCALLLDIDTTVYKNTGSTDPYMVYSFERCKNNDQFERFAIQLAENQKMRAVKIEWLHPKSSVKNLLENLELIKNSKFAISDIYHFSINAWRERVPTLTIGRGNSYPSQGTLGDKKKEIFNSQILAMNYYLFFEDVVSGINNIDKKLFNDCVLKINNTSALDIVFEKIRSQTEYAKKILIEEILKDESK
jgi:hypothetical protein